MLHYLGCSNKHEAFWQVASLLDKHEVDSWSCSYLKMGLSMAQLRAQPLDTHSFAFRVLLGSLSNTSLISCSRAGTRELLPTISTEVMLSFLMPELSKA